MQRLAKQIHEHLQGATKIVIVPHQNSDADALGSATALYEHFKETNQPAGIFCLTPVNPKLSFLPHTARVSNDPTIFNDRAVTTIIVLDSGDLRYAGVEKLLKNHPATIINIDHHATNEGYGHFNLVNRSASSTCEILYHYFKHNRISINRRMATSLLSGITTDTGNFTNSASSAEAMFISAELIRAGADVRELNNSIIRDKTVSLLHLWGKVFSRLDAVELTIQNQPVKLTHTYLTRADLLEHQVSDTDLEGLANFLNNLDNTDVALILKETLDGKIKGSFRTKKDEVDVSAMAKRLSGGGHKKAAGFTTDGTIEQVLNKILTNNP